MDGSPYSVDLINLLFTMHYKIDSVPHMTIMDIIAHLMQRRHGTSLLNVGKPQEGRGSSEEVLTDGFKGSNSQISRWEGQRKIYCF